MTSSFVSVTDIPVLPTPIAGVLYRIGITSLNLQARARLHEQQDGRILADQQSPIARASLETQSNLVAMSRYCLQQLVPRIHNLMQQAETVAEATRRAACQPAANPAADLTAIAAELDRCAMILRGHARTSLRVTGMIRMSEQRLWGALAAELHRIEGTDGPIMRACARIETMAFDLASAVDEAMETEGDLPLPRRHALCIALIHAAWEAGNGVISDAELTRLLEPLGERLPEIRDLVINLMTGHRALRAMSRHVGRALSIATEASAQSAMTARLEDMFRDLDSQLGALAGSYRKLARKMGQPAIRAQATELVATDAQHWRMAMQALHMPMMLSEAGAESAVHLREGPCTDGAPEIGLRA